MAADPILVKMIKAHKKRMVKNPPKFAEYITVDNWIEELRKNTGVNFTGVYTLIKQEEEPNACMCGFELADSEHNADFMFHQCEGGLHTCDKCIFKNRKYITSRIKRRRGHEFNDRYNHHE